MVRLNYETRTYAQIVNGRGSRILHIHSDVHKMYDIYNGDPVTWTLDGDKLHMEQRPAGDDEKGYKVFFSGKNLYVTIPALYADTLDLGIGDYVQVQWQKEPILRMTIFKDDKPLGREEKRTRKKAEARNEQKVIDMRRERDEALRKLESKETSEYKLHEKIARLEFARDHPNKAWELETAEDGKWVKINRYAFERKHGRQATPDDTYILDVRNPVTNKTVLMTRALFIEKYGREALLSPEEQEEARRRAAEEKRRARIAEMEREERQIKEWEEKEKRELEEEEREEAAFFLDMPDDIWNKYYDTGDNIMQLSPQQFIKDGSNFFLDLRSCFGSAYERNPYFLMHCLYHTGELPHDRTRQLKQMKHAIKQFNRDLPELETNAQALQKYEPYVRYIGEGWDIQRIVNLMKKHPPPKRGYYR